MQDAFATIASNVERRGYREGWTPAQFEARQVVKMLEEACEALAHTGLPKSTAADTLITLAHSLKDVCDVVFHDEASWGKGEQRDPQLDGNTDREVADVLVCIANYASSRKTNIMLMAMQKSEADIIRGVG